MDKRKNNGGNSTRATRPDDKRLKSNKSLLDKYIKDNVDDKKIKELLEAHYQLGIKGDSRSAKMWFEYVLGKPKETKDIKVEVDKNFPDWLDEG